MSEKSGSIKDVLYEPPGPRTKKYILIGTILSILALVVLAAAVIRQFYINGQLDAKYWSFFTKYTTWRFLGQGLVGTITVAVVSGIIAFALGMLFMLGRISKYKWLCGISRALIEFTRGVPTLLLIYFFFLVVPQLGISLPAFWKIAAPVAISAPGVVAEVLRSGVNAVPKGQTEAAQSLGMRWGSVFFKIVFPQALRYVVPALISELVIVLKDTTFAYVVSYADLMQNAKVLISNYDALLSIYLVVAVIYILINYVLHRLSVLLAERSTAKGTAVDSLERNVGAL
ncbi:MAG: amino acid ABC transporter permease [Clostridiales bacterium]|nr:amino acid ABC transporter permease [Clostridiales bacterium]